MASEVNFSDRAKRPRDPHRWQDVKGQLRWVNRTSGKGYILNDNFSIWICTVCHFWSTEHPKWIRSEDMPTCISTHP